jgi:Xaa-Pro aminopeptidase
MERTFHIENRKAMYGSIKEPSLIIMFSGHAPRKTADEYYPFFANRNFVYTTGVESQSSIFMAEIDGAFIRETMFILPKDLLAERWTGKRLSADEVREKSGIENIEYVKDFDRIFYRKISSCKYSALYLDFDKFTKNEPDNEAYELSAEVKKLYPYINLRNLLPLLKAQRTIKKPCEIEAMKEAQKITRAGIVAMMKASKPGMYEYQYKAEFDYALAQHGVLAPAFPSIISAGANNFFIHYYGYRGQAFDGDMILNDVGACYDNECNDVSRGWPCNGIFSEKQKLLYSCAYNTSEYMFSIIKPGMPMAQVDATARKYNYEQLKEIGLCKSYDDISKYMWHGGAHHVGYDVHDVVYASGLIVPGMVFCVDIGIYCEEWGIGFRLEDNCLATEDGCINLSAETPRSIEEIEDIMR